jgi:hypothetical protein
MRKFNEKQKGDSLWFRHYRFSWCFEFKVVDGRW